MDCLMAVKQAGWSAHLWFLCLNKISVIVEKAWREHFSIFSSIKTVILHESQPAQFRNDEIMVHGSLLNGVRSHIE